MQNGNQVVDILDDNGLSECDQNCWKHQIRCKSNIFVQEKKK